MSTDRYTLAVDLGTARTAAAVARPGTPAVAVDLGGSLGAKGPTTVSAVYTGADGSVLIGDPALRRGLADPAGLAREFKRRTGDTTPILLRGVPWSVAALTARLLRGVVDIVIEREGGPPSAVVLTHPANWGRYKIDVLAEAAALADVRVDRFVPEPEAAAIHYARQARVPVGATVAVYDLGGGTFDVAVLRKTEAGFELAGPPEGIDALGGADADAAVFAAVTAALGGAYTDLDRGDPATLSATWRLRQACTEAKEALSADADVSIPVALPTVATEVRLTRSELEAVVEPMLAPTIGALRRALRAAAIESGQLDAVLLTGGAARMPIVARLVSNEIGRPVAIDIDPKLAVALGAATVLVPPDEAAVPAAAVAEVAATVTPTPSAAPVPSRRRPSATVVALGLGACAVAGAGAWWALAGRNTGRAVAAPATTTVVAGTPATTTPTVAPVPVTTASATTASATTVPTTGPATTAPGGAAGVPVSPITGRGVQIVEIVPDDVLGTYEVRFRVAGFSLADGTHVVHLFGDDVRPEQAGFDAAERGVARGAFVPGVYQSPWEFRPDAISPAATRLCAVVADAKGALDDPATFSCAPLPPRGRS